MAGGVGFITAADATIVFAAPPVFPIGQLIEGFAPDDVFEVPQRRLAQVEMGVDDFMAVGFVYQLQPWNFTLQASSPSVSFFDAVAAASEAAGTVFLLQGEVTLPSTGSSWTLQNGVLVDYAPAPSVGQVQRPRKFNLVWQKVIVNPAIPAVA